MSDRFWRDFFMALFARNVSQRRIKKFIRNIRMMNLNRLGVDHFAPTAADTLLANPGDPKGSIVSGGSDRNRACILCATARKGVREHVPVVVLHTGDALLMKRLGSVFGGQLWYVDGMHRMYDPFCDKDATQCQALLTELDDKLALHPAVRYLAQVALRLLQSSRTSFCLADLWRLEASTLYEEIAHCEQIGLLSQPEANELRDLLTKGSAEHAAWDALLSELTASMHWLTPDTSLPMRQSLLSAFQNGYSVVAIELPHKHQDMAVGCLLYELALLCARGTKPLVLFDDVSLVAVDSLRRWAQSGFFGAVPTIASKDTFALHGSDKRLFQCAMQNVEHCFAMKHTNAAAAEPISELFGESKWTAVETGTSDGWDVGRQLLGASGGDFVHTTQRMERRILPEDMLEMDANELFVLGVLSNGRILHTILMDV